MYVSECACVCVCVVHHSHLTQLDGLNYVDQTTTAIRSQTDTLDIQPDSGTGICTGTDALAMALLYKIEVHVLQELRSSCVCVCICICNKTEWSGE